MAGFEESDLYAAFGLEQPAGGNEPGAAEPGAQEGQAQGTEPGTGEAQEPAQTQEQDPSRDQGDGGAQGGAGGARDVSGASQAEGGQEGEPAQQTKEQPPQGGRGIRNEAEVDFSVLHAIAHIVRTVMRYIERRNFKTVQLQGLPLLQEMYVFCFQFRICTIITLDSVVYKFGGIDRKPILIRQAPDSFDVVCMVMRNQHGLYLFQGKPVSMKMFFQCSYPNSGINQYPIIF